MANKINISGPQTIGDAVALPHVVASGAVPSASNPEVRSDSAQANSGLSIAEQIIKDGNPKEIKKLQGGFLLVNPCPVCKSKDFDGEDCTACGFNADKYSVAGFKALLKRQSRKESKPRQTQAKRGKKPSKEPIKLKSGIKIFRKGTQPLSQEEIALMKDKADEERSGHISARIARDSLREIDSRIKKEKFVFPMARFKMISQVIQELKEQIT